MPAVIARGRADWRIHRREIRLAVLDTIVTRAPTRIDFGGGWTDVPPYSDEEGGFVCNLAITRYATATVLPHRGIGEPAPTNCTSAADRSIIDAARRRFGDARDVSVASDFPLGAGLGGSSAAGVAVVAALTCTIDQHPSRSEIAELSRAIEIGDLGIPGGRQDHYAAAYGGALGLRFSRDHVDVRPLDLRDETKHALERQCLIVYTGQSRISGDTIDAVLGAYRRGEPRVLHALARMKALAEESADALAAGDVRALGRLIGEQWTHQRTLHPAIPTARIDEIVARAANAGAIGSKALGASGGGCVLVIAAPDRVAQVRDAVAALGELLSFEIDEHGVQRCQ
jgi:D-glycero-alpha-D-manno-heptose-7-phosphate kinase